MGGESPKRAGGLLSGSSLFLAQNAPVGFHPKNSPYFLRIRGGRYGCRVAGLPLQVANGRLHDGGPRPAQVGHIGHAPAREGGAPHPANFLVGKYGTEFAAMLAVKPPAAP